MGENKKKKSYETTETPNVDLDEIIASGDPEKLVQTAESVGKRLAQLNLSTSQIRAIFGEVRQIEAEWPLDSEKARRKFILLKPKMAYRARKESGQGVKELVRILDPAVDLVTKERAEEDRRFKRFVEFFEAILAYHKAHGGK